MGSETRVLQIGAVAGTSSQKAAARVATVAAEVPTVQAAEASAAAGASTSGAIDRIRAQAPAIFRLDDNYTQADNARILNRFGRDTVHAFQVIGETVAPVIEEQAALTAAVAAQQVQIDGILEAIAALDARVTELENAP